MLAENELKKSQKANNNQQVDKWASWGYNPIYRIDKKVSL